MLNVKHIKSYIATCKQLGYSDEATLAQLAMFCDGHRGVELADTCIVLLDGYDVASRGLSLTSLPVGN